MKRIHIGAVLVAGLIAVIAGGSALATHSWANYHWARQSNSFTLKLGDNVSSKWDAQLAQASSDWSTSDVLDTVIVASEAGSPALCLPTSGRVEVCSTKYGPTGWLGIAQIWIDTQDPDHITQARVALNDTYFGRGSTYDTPAWRQMVMCQEIGHTLGLDHQDANFNNANLGTCMDYTSDPSTNQHPNVDDYDMLKNIYSHTDGSTTVDVSDPQPPTDGGPGGGKKGGNKNNVSVADRQSWGQQVSGAASGAGGLAVFQRDLGNGAKVVTYVIWAE